MTVSVFLESPSNGADGCRRYKQHAPVCLVPVAVHQTTFGKLRLARSVAIVERTMRHTALLVTSRVRERRMCHLAQRNTTSQHPKHHEASSIEISHISSHQFMPPIIISHHHSLPRTSPIPSLALIRTTANYFKSRRSTSRNTTPSCTTTHQPVVNNNILYHPDNP